MKFGDICKSLQPHGDIKRFMKKKELMNAIIGKFINLYKFSNYIINTQCTVKLHPNFQKVAQLKCTINKKRNLTVLQK